jgi:glyceraldehyde 3-phosphate dehydrogenase
MAIKVAINGYGRIGRNVLRAIYESNRQGEIQVVAINDLGDADTNAHLTQYDTAHGKFPGTVSAEDGFLVVNGDRIVLAERDPAKRRGPRSASTSCSNQPDCSPRKRRPVHIAGGAKKVSSRRLARKTSTARSSWASTKTSSRRSTR